MYDVQLAITSGDGCTDTIIKSIEIYLLPEAGFTFSHQGFGRYAFTPDNAGLSSYNWDFGDGNSSTDASPIHKFDKEDDFDVTLTTTDNNTCSSEMTNEISVSTSIEEVVASPFKVYPNPFSDEVNIAYQLQSPGNVTIEVYNMDGKRLTSIVSQKQLIGEYQYQFATPDASGIYMIRMVVDGNVYHERIVKTK